MARSELKLGEITSQQQDEEMLRKLLALSTSIFDPDTPEKDLSPSNWLSNWKANLEVPGAALIYVKDADMRPFGFFFTYPRTIEGIGYELLHIWVACVDPAYRGLGIFPLLMDKAKNHARELGYGEISVVTYPKRFTQMYRILTKHGWEEVCWLEKDVKLLLKMPV